MEKTTIKPCERAVFAFTLVSFLVACVLMIIELFRQGSYANFLPLTFFVSPIFWIIATAVTVWYIYKYGIPKAKKSDNSNEKVVTILSFLVPLFVGILIGLAAYYLIYWLAGLLAASLPYILVAIIAVGAAFAITFLIKLYFKPQVNQHRTLLIWTLLLVALLLLVLAIYWFTKVSANV